MLIYPIGTSAACEAAGKLLPTTDHPCPEVTHVLLDIPSRWDNRVQAALESLPEGITLIGGNLTAPEFQRYRRMDLLRDPMYLAENAAITAECALFTAMERTKSALRRQPILVIGWGRIGKCLAKLLKAADADVTLLIRKASDRAMAQALGYTAIGPEELEPILPELRLILNTAPEPVISQAQAASCRKCVLIDLASLPGIGGGEVLRARGLPGKLAPNSSGKLIADTVLREAKV